MAKAIYPTVKKYLQEQKPIDEALVKAYVHIYDTKFLQWRRELNHLMRCRYIVADKESEGPIFVKPTVSTPTAGWARRSLQQKS